MTDEINQTSSVPKMIEQILERGEIASVVTIVRGPGAVGAKLLVYENGATAGTLGDPALDSLVVEQAAAFLSSREETRMFTVSDFAPDFPAARETSLLF